MISAWLVRSGLFEEARDSLDYFTERRTDKTRGKKTQGVDTPSQSRYVGYYQQMISDMNRNLPPPLALRLSKLTLHEISGKHADHMLGDGLCTHVAVGSRPRKGVGGLPANGS